MAQRFDRSQEDAGNSVQLEHLNLRQPDQRLATIFYFMGMGFTRDPYLMVGVDNMWVNIGRSQIHLPTGEAQRMPGMAFRPATTISRRAWNSTTMASTSSCGPVRASTAPTWAKVGAHEIVLMTSWA